MPCSGSRFWQGSLQVCGSASSCLRLKVNQNKLISFHPVYLTDPLQTLPQGRTPFPLLSVDIPAGLETPLVQLFLVILPIPWRHLT